MKIVRYLLLSVVFITTALVVIGHQDIIAKPTRIEFAFPRIGTVVLEVDGAKLSALSLNKGGIVSSVAKVDLAGISCLQLDTLHIGYGMYFSGDLDGVLYESVRIRFGAKEEMQFGEYPEVCFTFHNGEYSHRTVWRATDARGSKVGQESISPGQWKGRKNIDPSKAVSPTGPIVMPQVESEPPEPKP